MAEFCKGGAQYVSKEKSEVMGITTYLTQDIQEPLERELTWKEPLNDLGHALKNGVIIDRGEKVVDCGDGRAASDGRRVWQLFLHAVFQAQSQVFAHV